MKDEWGGGLCVVERGGMCGGGVMECTYGGGRKGVSKRVAGEIGGDLDMKMERASNSVLKWGRPVQFRRVKFEAGCAMKFLAEMNADAYFYMLCR